MNVTVIMVTDPSLSFVYATWARKQHASCDEVMCTLLVS